MQAAVGQFIALIVVVWTGLVASLFLFDLYRVTSSAAQRPWARKSAFTLERLGGFSYARLALASAAALFLELLLIRWISSEIRIFAYFKNFVLIACFLGFGLGCYWCRRQIHWIAVLGPLILLALLIKLPWLGLRSLIWTLPAYLGAISEVNIWGVPSLPLSSATLGGLAMAMAVIIPLFALIAVVFVPLGQMVGWYLENSQNGILGYTVNILASLAGIVLYTALCFSYQPPAVWFLVAGALLVALVWKVPGLRWSAVAAFALCVGLVSLGPMDKDVAVHWSPYQKLALKPIVEKGETISYQLTTNDNWYQQVIDLSPQFAAAHPHLFREVAVEWNAYNLPYHFKPDAESVLVLGAGMGNDVAAALRNSRGRVVAVEIDPLILDLGRRLHFERPYDSPRVRQVIDDARSYIQNAPDRFDLILFSLLDSHTTSSHYSNIRIDNYVYTVEALEAARRLLAPDGLFIVKFQVDTPWIAGRLRELLGAVFRSAPLELQGEESDYSTPGRFFITGSRQQIDRVLADPKLAAYAARHGKFAAEKASLTTDDWPYFYQHEPGLPASVLVLSAVLVVLCGWLMSKTEAGGRSVRWHFFFLGAGFLLLEAQIISKMALLFGTTWLVNSIVIAVLLLLIVGANILVGIKPRVPTSLAYGGMAASIAVSYLVPTEAFLFPSFWLKALAATGVFCLPVFFAGIIFIKGFARAGFCGEAMGSNLLGALVGGLLESLSLWTGLKSLLLVAGVLYLASYLALRAEAPVAARRLEARSTGPTG